MAELTAEQIKALDQIIERNKLKELKGESDAASDSLSDLSESALEAGKSTKTLYETVNTYLETSKKVGAVNKEAMESLGMLNGVLFNTKTYFNNASTEGISTFSSQLSGLQNFLRDEFNLPSKLGALQKYVQDSPFKNLIPASAMNDMGALKNEILKVAQNMFTAADNSLRLRQSFIQTAASVGMLDEVMIKSGQGFERINDLVSNHQAALASAAKANGLNIETMERLYTTLGRIPGFFKDATDAAAGNTNQLDKLTKVIQLSLGLGRSQYDVIKDLELAYRTYGATGEAAFEFTTKISKITQNYDLELNRLQSSLNNTASSFSKFTDTGNSANLMLAGTANIYNQLIGSFKDTGLTGERAVDIVSKMTGSINNLSLAQKSFLSAQTGGPGGLMGGLQIEQMLREGKIEEVFGKVRQQMEKQLGNIVTLDEAARSPAAAAQFTRQRTMLMQSPLAKFATTEDEASRVLEVFKGMQEGKGVPKDFEKDILKNSLESGKQLQMQSYTQLSAINSSLDELKTSFFTPMLNVVQKGFAARVGTTVSDETDATRAMRASLKAQKDQAESQSATSAKIIRELMALNANIPLVDVSGKQAFEAISSLRTGVLNMPNVARSAVDTIIQPFQAEYKKATGTKPEADDLVKRTLSEAARTTTTQPVNANADLVAPAARPPAPNSAGAATTPGPAPETPPALTVSVDVNAICTTCKEKLESQHAHATAPATPKP